MIDERIYAKLVWRSPDGNEHPQWTAYKDPRPCRCGERHKLADAAARLICPGVAHTWTSHVCELCGLGWRVLATSGFLSAPVIPGGALSVILMDLDAPPAPRPARCIYCMTLDGNPAALERHRVQAHPQENH